MYTMSPKRAPRAVWGLRRQQAHSTYDFTNSQIALEVFPFQANVAISMRKYAKFGNGNLKGAKRHMTRSWDVLGALFG